jgi:hypothetical protein
LASELNNYAGREHDITVTVDYARAGTTVTIYDRMAGITERYTTDIFMFGTDEFDLDLVRAIKSLKERIRAAKGEKKGEKHV